MKVAQIVTNQLIEKLEDAIKNNKRCFWQQAWKGVPKQNYLTGHQYTGINRYLLSEDEVFFLTFKQIKQLEAKYPTAQLKKGSKGQMITYVNTINIKNNRNEDDDEMRTVKFLRYYIVFRASDVDGIPKKEIEKNDKILSADEIVKKSCCEIKNVFGSNRAYYSPKDDLL